MKRIDLLVPGVSGWPQCRQSLPDRARRDVAALALWCGRGHLTTALPQGVEATLLFLAELTTAPQQNLPVAAISRYGEADPGPEGGFWLRADPVHLRADHDQVRLYEFSPDAITAHEAQCLTDSIAALYRDHQWQVLPLASNRWYFRLPEAPRWQNPPLDEVAGAPIPPLLPAGPDGGRWQRTLTEIQMLLHQHPLNHQREREGRDPINGVWFWGGGVPPEITGLPWQTIASDEVFATGLARLAPATTTPVPLRAETVLSTLRERALVVVSDLRAPAKNRSFEPWWARLQQLDQQWLAPLVAALRRREIDELNLYDGCGRRFTLTGKRWRFFWNRTGLDLLLS